MLNLFDYIEDTTNAKVEGELTLSLQPRNLPTEVAGQCYAYTKHFGAPARIADDPRIWEELASFRFKTKVPEEFFEIFWDAQRTELELDEYFRYENEVASHVAGRDEVLWDASDDSFVEPIYYKDRRRAYRRDQAKKHSGKPGRYLWDKNGLFRKPKRTEKRARNTYLAGKGGDYKKVGGGYYG